MKEIKCLSCSENAVSHKFELCKNCEVHSSTYSDTTFGTPFEGEKKCECIKVEATTDLQNKFFAHTGYLKNNCPIHSSSPTWQEIEEKAWQEQVIRANDIGIAMFSESIADYWLSRMEAARTEAYEAGKKTQKYYFKDREQIRREERSRIVGIIKDYGEQVSKASSPRATMNYLLSKITKE